MKHSFACVCAIVATMSAFAEKEADQEAVKTTDVVAAQVEEVDPVWPAFFAISEWPASPDVIGLRLTLPYSTVQESVTGIDLGFWGRCNDFEGFQINVFRNDVKDTFGGIQVGLYNSVNRADLFCVQVGLFNETQSFRGLQVGLINLTGDVGGFQVGIINRAETMHGYQLGLINVIRDAELPVMPILNIGF